MVLPRLASIAATVVSACSFLAVDVSDVAIAGLSERAAAEGLRLIVERRDLESEGLPEGPFELIVVTDFLDRSLFPRITSALGPGGVLFYETFTRISVSDKGPSNPDYRLADNELLALFSPLQLRVYREENRLGDLSEGSRDIAMLVAQKPGEAAGSGVSH